MLIFLIKTPCDFSFNIRTLGAAFYNELCVVNMLDLSWAHLLNWNRRGVSHWDATLLKPKEFL